MSLPPDNDAPWNKAPRASREDRFDASIRKVLTEVAPPAGAMQRLLTRLESAPELTVVPSSSREEASSESVSTPTVSAAKKRRRWAVWSAAAVASIAASLFVAMYLSRPAGPINVEHVLASGLTEFVGRDSVAGEVHLVAATPPRDRFSLPKAIVAAPNAKWRAVTFLGRRGVAYEFTSRFGARGSLYVVPVAGRPPLPQLARQPLAISRSTAGRSTTAWTDGQRLFVLVARGGKADLGGFLRPAAPVA